MTDDVKRVEEMFCPVRRRPCRDDCMWLINEGGELSCAIVHKAWSLRTMSEIAVSNYCEGDDE